MLPPRPKPHLWPQILPPPPKKVPTAPEQGGVVGFVAYLPTEFERYLVTGKASPELWGRLATFKKETWTANFMWVKQKVGL